MENGAGTKWLFLHKQSNHKPPPHKLHMLICSRKMSDAGVGEQPRASAHAPLLCDENFLKPLENLTLEKTCDSGKSDFTIRFFVLLWLVSSSSTTWRKDLIKVSADWSLEIIVESGHAAHKLFAVVHSGLSSLCNCVAWGSVPALVGRSESITLTSGVETSPVGPRAHSSGACEGRHNSTNTQTTTGTHVSRWFLFLLEYGLILLDPAFNSQKTLQSAFPSPGLNVFWKFCNFSWGK